LDASSCNLSHYEGTPFATRRGVLSAFGPRQAAASRKPPSWRTKTPASRASRKTHGAPTSRYMKAHKISRINELPPQKGIFRVISCRALGPCSCPADGAPAGAAVVARLARHRLKPCRGDTAECCHKATRRSQGSWSRVIRPRRQASGCLSARCTCGEAVRSPDERSEELCEAKSQEGAREPRRGRKGPSANTVSQPSTRSTRLRPS
jgi:hypothetical protein